MTDVPGLAVRAVALTELAKRIKTAADAARAELFKALDPADRKSARLSDGTKVGYVTKSDPKSTATVVDESAFTEWVLATYPDEIVPTVRTSFQTALLDGAEDAGIGVVVDGRTGEVIPGVEFRASASRVSVVPDSKNEAAMAALADAIKANGLLALDGSQ